MSRAPSGACGMAAGGASAACASACCWRRRLAVGCPIPPPPPVTTTVSGVYTTRGRGETGPRVITLWLQPGGSASLETVVVGKESRRRRRGRGSASGDELTVRLGADSTPLVYTIDQARLVPKQWDRDGLRRHRPAAGAARELRPAGPTLFEPQQRPDDTP